MASKLLSRLTPSNRISLLFPQNHTFQIADGLLYGTGQLKTKEFAFYAQDFSHQGGSLSLVQAEAICSILQHASNHKLPVVGIWESGGARIQDGADALYGYSRVFKQIASLSGVIPQVSLITGATAGGSVYAPALSDFIFIVRKTGQMFLTGPEVVKAATSEISSREQLGGSDLHEYETGLVHGAFDNEVEMLQAMQVFLEMLALLCEERQPAKSLQKQHRELDKFSVFGDDDGSGDESLLEDFVPRNPNEPYDMGFVVRNVLDAGSFYELQAHYAPNVIIGLGRLAGNLVGIVANQPNVLSGVLDCAASRKAAKFIGFCNAFAIPIVSFVDVPGFLPGIAQESKGVIREGAELLRAYCNATRSLKASVIVRKAYGGAYCVMSSKGIGSDLNYAWPNCQVAVMGAKAAVSLFLHKKLPENSKEQLKAIEELEKEHSQTEKLVEKGYIDRIIKPSETRRILIKDLFGKSNTK